MCSGGGAREEGVVLLQSRARAARLEGQRRRHIMADQIDLEKLKKLQARTKQGSKGAPRKKNISKKASTGSTDQKVATALKKLQVGRAP